MRRIGIGSDSLVSNTAVSLAGIELSQRRPCGVAHVTVPVLTGPAHADRTAILGHVGNNDDLRTAWHAPSFDEDVELDFAKTAGKSNLLRGRDVLIAEEDDAVIIVGALDSGEGIGGCGACAIIMPIDMPPARFVTAEPGMSRKPRRS